MFRLELHWYRIKLIVRKVLFLVSFDSLVDYSII